MPKVRAKGSGQQVRLTMEMMNVQDWVKVCLHTSSCRDHENLPSPSEGERKKGKTNTSPQRREVNPCWGFYRTNISVSKLSYQSSHWAQSNSCNEGSFQKSRRRASVPLGKYCIFLNSDKSDKKGFCDPLFEYVIQILLYFSSTNFSCISTMYFNSCISLVLQPLKTLKYFCTK